MIVGLDYMSNKTLNICIKNKRDSNSNFETNNPILLNGELVIIDDESDRPKIKIGDGVSTYSQLPFFDTVYSEKPVYTYTEINGLSDVLDNLQQQINVIPIIPSGMIMIWSGDSSNVPDGWVLCDGTNGTPDLSDKFVLGAGNTHSVGDTGGSDSVSLTVDEIPSHNHNLSYDVITGQSGGTTTIANSSWFGSYNAVVINSTEDTGGGQAHNNMPPYYTLCYIMKV